MDEDSPFSHFLGDHLKELRRRVLVVFGAVSLFTAVAYYFSRPIAGYLVKPIFNASPEVKGLVYTHLAEAFVGYIKLAVLVGVAAAFPVGCYELWMFVAPGLRKREKKVALVVSFWATFLFVGGMIFAYFIALPEILTFLMDRAGAQLAAKPRLDSYLTFVARTVIAFGLAFEIPFLMVVAGRAGLASRGYFVEKRWVSYIVVMALSFLLTAGELLGATLLALPLIVLYEIGVLLMLLFSPKPIDD